MVAEKRCHEEDLCELVKHEGVDTFMFDKLTHVCLDIGNGLGVGNKENIFLCEVFPKFCYTKALAYTVA